MLPRSKHFLPLLAVSVVLTAGCKDRRIENYAIRKEPHPALVQPEVTRELRSDVLPAPEAAAASPLVWNAPAHWKPKAVSAIRRASFDVPMDSGGVADFSAIVLNGAAGGVLANVNRWRGQLGLAALADGQLAANSEVVAANGLSFTIVDLAGQTGGVRTRMLAAIAEFGGDTWFFKLSGPAAGVAHEKASFIEFLHTVKSL